MSNRLPGNVLGLQIGDSYVACETSCELTFEQELKSASSVEKGRWNAYVQGLRSWSISLNAAMLISSAGADAFTILNAFMTGERMRISFRTKFPGYGSFIVSGYVVVQSGGVSAQANTGSNWNVVLQGDEAFNMGAGTELTAYYGFRIADPYGDEINLIPQFSKFIADGAVSVSFDFTVNSAGNYLFAKVPTGQPVYNAWENNEFNFGDIPDYAWREKVTVAGFDYYMSRMPLFITSAVPIITFRLKSSTPNDFDFNEIINALLNTVYQSDPITITGITEPVPIDIADGEYSINGSPFTSTDGFVPPNASLVVRLTTGPFYEYTNSAIVNIGGKSASFDVTTTEAIGNDAIIGDFTRNNCPSGQIGSSVSYTLPANTYFSDTKDKANAMAQTAFPILGQNYANDPVNGATCSVGTSKNFTLAQDGRRLRLTADSSTITCAINVIISYTINGGSSVSSRTLDLPANTFTALNNGGSITPSDIDTIDIISFTFTPATCSGEVITINGQEG